MASHPFDRLFAPRAIAVLGASETPGKIGRIVFERLAGSDSDRRVFPVHPTRKTILGHTAYPSVAALPAAVDVAILTMGAEASVAATKACADHGIGFIIPLAGGFAELGEVGRQREQRLGEAIAGSRSRILGPNTLGISVPANHLDTIFVDHAHSAPGGGVGFVTQSGSVGTEALAVAANIGFGLSAFVGLGNRVDIDESEALAYLGRDPATRCVALYLETLADGRDFVQVAREVALDKPVVALKAGRTPAGAAAASSHTGRLAGSDRVVDGAFRQFGIQRVCDEEQLCDAARVLARAPLPRGPRVAVVSPGGGYGVMATDYVESTVGMEAIEMASFTDETIARLRAIAPGWASVTNPVDLSASASDDMTIAAIEAILADDGVDMLLSVTLFAPPAITTRLSDRLVAVQEQSEKPLLALVQHGEYTDSTLRRLFHGGVVGFPSVARAVRGLSTLAARVRICANLTEAR